MTPLPVNVEVRVKWPLPVSQEKPVWQSVRNRIEIAKPLLMQKWTSLGGVWQESQGLLHSQRVLHAEHDGCILLPNQPIRLLSFNIQAGLPSGGYMDYVRNGFRQIVPAVDCTQLDRIAETISAFDIVMLQEVDCGSIRSGFVNQLSYLAESAGFEFAHQQLNRDMGRFGQFSNGFLSRFIPYRIENHRLPGLKGRGAIIARFRLSRADVDVDNIRVAEPSLVVVGLHLALGARARERQIDYVMTCIQDEPHVIVMGDLNCCEQSAIKTALGYSTLEHVNFGMGTFPSWAPRKCIDHIWISPSIEVTHVEVLPTQLSDHRPLSAHVCLPEFFARPTSPNGS